MHYRRWRKHGDPLIVLWIRGEGTSYAAIHRWMHSNFPLVGRCEVCGEERYTEYACPGHTYTRNREDWAELCKPCHKKLDGQTWQQMKPGEYQLAKTHCPQGHPYDQANTYVGPRGDRQCRACGRERAARNRAAA